MSTRRALVINLEKEKLVISISETDINNNAMWKTIFTQIKDLRSAMVTTDPVAPKSVLLNADLFNKSVALHRTFIEIASASYAACQSPVLTPLLRVSIHPSEADISALVKDCTNVYYTSIDRDLVQPHLHKF